MSNNFDNEVFAYCEYCKNPIFEGELFKTEGSNIYCPDCLIQKNTYDDPYGVDDDLFIGE